MKVYTEGPYDGGVIDTSRVVSLLRRVGATVGFSVGFGLLAVVMASQASAEGTQQGDDGAQQRAEGSPLGALDPVIGSLNNVLSPVTGSIPDSVSNTDSSVVRPVVEPITGSILGPVLRPVVESVVAPVLAPVVNTVTIAVVPVLNAVTPVTGTLDGPVPHAVDPVVEPVLTGTGPQDEVSSVTGSASTERQKESGTVVPQDTSVPSPQPEPALLWVNHAETSVTPARTVRWDAYWADSAGAGDSMLDVGSSRPGQVPSVPFGSVQPMGPAPGGSGSVGGFGAAHSGDAAVSAPRGPMANNDSSGRSPPDTVAAHSWFGYAQPECPS